MKHLVLPPAALAVSLSVFVPLALSGAPSMDPRFGAMTHYAQGQNVAWADTVSALGVATVRDELYWNSLENPRGTFSYPSEYENYMAKLKADNIAPFIVLNWGNNNYDGGDSPYDADGLSGYTNYANQLLSHYGSQIGAVEVWNEYNGTWCTGPATANRPLYYTNMLKAAYAGIKAARPDVTVAGGGTAGIALGYWEQLMQEGALGSMDVESVHPYRYNQAPEGIEDDIIALQNLTKLYNNGQAKPIWVSEIGWIIQSGNATTLNIDAPTQAKFLARAYPLLLSAGAQRVYWYDYSDDVGISVMGLTDPTDTPRASGLAFQAMSAELSGAAFIRREYSLPGLYSMLFQRANGTQVRVLWSLGGASFTASGATKIVDLSGNPLATSGTITLTDAPIYVEGPLAGLPAATETPVADAETDFTNVQGNNGWYYGYANGSDMGSFSTASTSYSDGVWSGPHYYLNLTAVDQMPSSNGSAPVATVKRWVSPFAGNVHIIGQFTAEQAGNGGDGVGVTVYVNGQAVTARALIGNTQATFASNFDVTAAVQVGSTVDFAVDPGPAADNSYDATAVYAKISQVLPPPPPPAPAIAAAPVIAAAPASGAPTATVLADSAAGFSGTQGQNGWSYGDFATGTAFESLTSYSGGTWTSSYPYITATAIDQHPSSNNGAPVSVVRRWTSAYAGAIAITGQFQTENTGGDGVGVSVLQNGLPVLARALLGGTPGNATQEAISLNLTVNVGDTIDFVVDPGPAADINFDATAVSATITEATPAPATSSSASSAPASSPSSATGTPTGSTAGSTTGTAGSTSTQGATGTSGATITVTTPSVGTVLANSSSDFSGTQGGNGWYYGDCASGATFQNLATYGGGTWTAAYPYLTVTAIDQHPSNSGSAPVSAVRRWVSTFAGTVAIAGQFQAENTGGDGAGVTVLQNGQPILVRTLLGGAMNNPTQESFNLNVTVRVGDTIDFVVDPGPATDINFDAMALSATIAVATPGASTASTSGGTPAGTVLANSSSDFSGTQGANGWYYGDFASGATFQNLATYGGGTWTAAYPYLTVTAIDQHPSNSGSGPVSAVRRWVSTFAGTVAIAGQFQAENTGGDGAGVTVLQNGQPILVRTLLGGAMNNPTQESFNLNVTVQVGDTIDFVVDPGPATDINFDAMALSAIITAAAPGASTASTSGGTPAGTVLANAVSGFSLDQGQGSWIYGYYAGASGAIGSWTGATLKTLAASGSSWTGPYPSLGITATTLSPSAVGLVQYAAVRRWTSTYTGSVRVAGAFTDSRNGDGVGVGVYVNGKAKVARTVIGVSGPSLTKSFTFVQAVVPGTTIDFVVDPGPGRNYTGDTTQLTLAITSSN